MGDGDLAQAMADFLKLAAIRRFYRVDNPAKGLKVPKDKRSREDSIKFLLLEGFKRLLTVAALLPPDWSRRLVDVNLTLTI